MRMPVIALSLAATALAGVVHAQGPGPRPDAVLTRSQAIADADARFARMDADRNGTVTAAEARAFHEAERAERDARVVTAAEFMQEAQARFARLDTDGDGRLTGEERRAGGPGGRGPRGPGPRGKGPHGPRHGGPDGLRDGPGGPPDGPGGPGKRPIADMTAAQHRERVLAEFDRADTNRDGRIDPAERAAARPMPPRPPVAG